MDKIRAWKAGDDEKQAEVAAGCCYQSHPEL